MFPSTSGDEEPESEGDVELESSSLAPSPLIAGWDGLIFAISVGWGEDGGFPEPDVNCDVGQLIVRALDLGRGGSCVGGTYVAELLDQVLVLV